MIRCPTLSRSRGRLGASLVVALSGIILLPGCSSKPKTAPKPPTVTEFRLIHNVGGTHHRTLVHQGVWYQTFNGSLLIIMPGEVAPARTVPLGRPGEVGPAVDMVVAASGGDEGLFIIIENDEVVELSLASPQAPEVVNRITAARLGIQPRRLSVVEGEVFVSGRGGVVRWRDQKRMLTSEDDAGRVARSEAGLFVCIGRRAVRLEDQRFLGSCSDAQTLPDGTIVFVRQSEDGAMVGLMSPDVREISTRRATFAMPAVVRSVRVFGGRIWAVSDDAITGYTMSEGGLVDPVQIDVLGARDIGDIGRERVVIAGTFGRAVYRLGRQGEAGTFVQVHREAGRLSEAITDGRHVLAGSREGLWMYLINSRAELTSRQFSEAPPAPALSATAMAGQARISDDRREVTVTPAPNRGGDAFTYSDPHGALLRCVAAINGDFWVGHDRGITVLRVSPNLPPRSKKKPDPSDHIAGQLRFEGPVLYLYPLLVGGGASFVSEYGGFGAAKFVEEPLPAAKAAPVRR